MDNRPIGIFDSGLGGLTAMSALRRLLPEENIIYFADTGRVPYGSKTPHQLRQMTAQDLGLVASRGVKAILAACGTVSANVGDVLEAYPVKAIGVLRPAVKAVGAMSGSGPVGVIATAASIQSGAYQRELKIACPERQVIAVSCPDFVTLIEGGCGAGDERVRLAVEKYLRPMKEAGVEILLLGCTHYGLISQAIIEYLGTDVELVSASDCAAMSMKDYLTEAGLTGGCGEEKFFTSGSAAEFGTLASVLLGRKIGEVSELPVMEVTEV